MVHLVLKPEVAEKKARLKTLSALPKDQQSAAVLKEIKDLQPLAPLRSEIEVRDFQVPGYISKTGAYMYPEQVAADEATENAVLLAENAVQAAINDLGLVTRTEMEAAIAAMEATIATAVADAMASAAKPATEAKPASAAKPAPAGK